MKLFHKKSTVLMLVLFGLLAACTKLPQTEGETAKTPLEEEPKSPEKADVLLPVNGDTCSEFENIENEPEMALVFFSWSVAAHTENYLLEVFESDTLVESITVDKTDAKVLLDKGQLYVWTVTSKNTVGEMKSDTFSFTTPGTPVGNFVPYTAQITVDFDTTNAEMTISWLGNDEDGDTLSYDLIVKEDGETIVEQSDITESSFGPIATIPGKNYLVEVVSFDPQGNYSTARYNETAPN